MARPSPKDLVLDLLFSRWRRPRGSGPGYTILLPSPADMPFLLRYSLEGLARIDTAHCPRIVVVPDGCGVDGGEALRRVAAEAGDPRVEVVGLRPLSDLVVHRMGRSGGAIANWTHWAAIVEGVDAARTDHLFLHDADAFFLEEDGLERHYRACLDRGMVTLGVTARLDPFFEESGFPIPGTWELMFSAAWARSRRPIDLKGRWRETPRGPHLFDTMLYPQFLDAPTGRVGVLDPPPRLLHFSGAITTYRAFRDRAGARVVDEFFRVLLLAMLEDLLPSPDGARTLPTVAELARGLDDPTAPVGYDSEGALEEYPVFRRMVADLCDSPIFLGGRGDRIRDLIRPFDDHFEGRALAGGRAPRGVRIHGLGGGEQ